MNRCELIEKLMFENGGIFDDYCFQLQEELLSEGKTLAEINEYFNKKEEDELITRWRNRPLFHKESFQPKLYNIEECCSTDSLAADEVFDYNQEANDLRKILETAGIKFSYDNENNPINKILEIRSIAQELREKGIPDEVIKLGFNIHTKLYKIQIYSNYFICVPELNKAIELERQQILVYRFFLNHPEGIKLQDLGLSDDGKEEWEKNKQSQLKICKIDHYRKLIENRWYPSIYEKEMREILAEMLNCKIEDLSDHMRNSILGLTKPNKKNEYNNIGSDISKLRTAFKTLLNDDMLADLYSISGRGKKENRKILVSRDMIEIIDKPFVV